MIKALMMSSVTGLSTMWLIALFASGSGGN